MPRYYFHFRHDHKALMDCEGSVLSDAAAARKQATRTVRDFLRPWLGKVDSDWAEWSLDVRDERGRRILDLALREAPRLEPGCPHLPVPSGPGAKVIHLDVERAKRGLAAARRSNARVVAADTNPDRAAALRRTEPGAPPAPDRAAPFLGRAHGPSPLSRTRLHMGQDDHRGWWKRLWRRK